MHKQEQVPTASVKSYGLSRKTIPTHSFAQRVERSRRLYSRRTRYGKI